MTKETKMTVSASPHIRSASTTTGIMLDVIVALIPALIVAVVIFGYRVLAVCGVTVGTAMLSEYIARKVMKRPGTLGDLSAVVTGLILAFNLPVSIPLWMAAIGSVVAIIVVKQFFGGIGQNFVNPALMGRIVLFVSFPSAMTNWVKALSWKTDAVTAASPLAVINNMFSNGDIAGAGEPGLPTLADMFFGVREGCLGEISAFALIMGGLYLLVRRVIHPAIPVTYIGTVAVFMLIAGKGSLTFTAYQIMGGGLLLGAIFMATDYATSPMNLKGKIVFGIGCGLLTAVIRLFGSMPEGVSFSIIIMNILSPHIERITSPKPFGADKDNGKKRTGKPRRRRARRYEKLEFKIPADACRRSVRGLPCLDVPSGVHQQHHGAENRAAGEGQRAGGPPRAAARSERLQETRSAAKRRNLRIL